MPASQSDVLSMIARLSNEMSPTLEKIKRSLQDFVGWNTKAQKDGTVYAQKHSFAIQDLKKAMEGASNHIKGVLTPAMAGLGVTALTTGGAIAAVTASVKAFGEVSIH
jgi:hypothetical protein